MSDHSPASRFSRPLGSVFGVLFAVSTLASTPPLCAQPRGAEPPTPTSGESSQAVPIPSDFVYSPLSSLSRNLKHAMSREDRTQTMGLIQAILDAPEDSFADSYFTENGQSVPSLKQVARDYIEQLPKTEFEKYRQRWEIDAEVLLERAREHHDQRLYLELADRYYFTRSGFEAVDWLATRALDLGRFHAAARLWNALIDSSIHGPSVKPPLLLKAVIANRLAGAGERATELMRNLQSTEPGRRLAGRLHQYLSTIERSTAPAEVPSLVGALPEEWSISLVDGLDPRQQQLLLDWRREQWGSSLHPLTIPRLPVRAGPYVCVAGFNDALLIDVETGQVRARYPLQSSLNQIVDQIVDYPLRQNSWTRTARQIDLHEKVVWNSIAGRVTTDGRSLFLIEGDDSWSQQRPQRPGERIRARIEDRFPNGPVDPVPVNRLVALPLPDPSELSATDVTQLEPRWVLGDQTLPDQGLNGSFFLAPPYAYDGFLYSLVEQAERLKLVCLDPLSGTLLWSQGLTHPGLDLFQDSARRFRSCEIHAAGGLLIANTQVGVIVAVDPVRRNLQWVYYVGDTEVTRGVPIAIQLSQISWGYLGFPDRPLLDGDRMYLLSRQSRYTHCIDVATGRRLWRTGRFRDSGSDAPADGDEYLGGVWGDTLLVVGDFHSRGLSRRDGSVLWTISHERISGIGTQSQSRYLLPLENSRVLAIDLDEGRAAELRLDRNFRNVDSQQGPAGLAGDFPFESHTPHVPRFGHLLAVDNRLISVGIEEIRGFPSPAIERAHLLARDELSPEQKLRSALLAGDDRDQRSFDALLELHADRVPPEIRRAAHDELVRRYLTRGDRDNAEFWNRLRPIAQTDEERIQLIIRDSLRQLQDRDAPGLLDSLRQLRRLESEQLFPVPGDEQLLVGQGVWARKIWTEAHRLFPADLVRAFDDFLRSESDAVLSGNDPAEMDRLLRLLPGIPELDAVRLARARLANRTGDAHGAELLLLGLRQRAGGEFFAEATLELADLWDESGLPFQAASLLATAESDPRFRESDGGSRRKAELLRRASFALAWRAQQPVTQPVQRAFVESLPPARMQSRLLRSYDSFMRIFVTPPESAFDLLMKRDDFSRARAAAARDGDSIFASTLALSDRALPVVEDKPTLAVISRNDGLIVGEYPIPERVVTGGRSHEMLVGNFFPVGCKGQVHGFSLLPSQRGSLAWSRSFLEPRLGQRPLTVGPVNPDFCAFRSDESLIVLDTREGRVLWRREGLPLHDSRQTGSHPALFGDHRVLNCSDSGASEFRHFDAFSGMPLAPESPLPWNGVLGTVGRYVVALRVEQPDTNRPLTHRVVIHDPESGRSVRSESGLDRRRSALHRDVLLLITPERRLKAIRVSTMTDLVDISLDAAEVSDVLVMQYFDDRDNHYINIRRTSDHARALDLEKSPRQANFTSTALMPSVDVQGVLIAVDKSTGRRRWSRELEPASILELPQYRLPCLLSFRWMTERRGIQKRRMQFEVLSTETGNTLGLSEDFVPLDKYTQIIQANYDPDAGEIEVNGPTYRARVRIGSPWNRLETEPDPF